MAALSLHKRIVDQTTNRIQLLGLTNIPTANVVSCRLPTDRVSTLPGLPGVLVSPFGQETLPPGSTETTDVGYPVAVTFVAAANQNFSVQDVELLWREAVIDAFIDQPLEGVPEVYDCQVEPLPIIDMGLFREQNLAVGGFVLRFFGTRVRVGRN